MCAYFSSVTGSITCTGAITEASLIMEIGIRVVSKGREIIEYTCTCRFVATYGQSVCQSVLFVRQEVPCTYMRNFEKIYNY